MCVLRVSAKSQPKSVAGALAALIKEKGNAEINAVGAGAVNQAIKAVAIARGFLVPIGTDICIVPSFSQIDIDGEDRTSIKMSIEVKK